MQMYTHGFNSHSYYSQLHRKIFNQVDRIIITLCYLVSYYSIWLIKKFTITDMYAVCVMIMVMKNWIFEELLMKNYGNLKLNK